eukprot:6226479-Amphidinium_carterae.1
MTIGIFMCLVAILSTGRIGVAPLPCIQGWVARHATNLVYRTFVCRMSALLAFPLPPIGHVWLSHPGWSAITATHNLNTPQQTQQTCNTRTHCILVIPDCLRFVPRPVP